MCNLIKQIKEKGYFAEVYKNNILIYYEKSKTIHVVTSRFENEAELNEFLNLLKKNA